MYTMSGCFCNLLELFVLISLLILLLMCPLVINSLINKIIIILYLNVYIEITQKSCIMNFQVLPYPFSSSSSFFICRNILCWKSPVLYSLPLWQILSINNYCHRDRLCSWNILFWWSRTLYSMSQWMGVPS